MLTNYGTVVKIFLLAIHFKIIINSCPCPTNTVDIKTDATGQKLAKIDNIEEVTEKKRKRCCPYNYDVKLCRTVGDRVLCGYNRNIGGPENGDGDIELQNDCRIRNGRLECGYNQPPFLNSRRPPVWDDLVTEEIEKINDLELSSKEEKPEKLYLKSTNTPQLTTRCVEIKERIVCRKM